MTIRFLFRGIILLLGLMFGYRNAIANDNVSNSGESTDVGLSTQFFLVVTLPTAAAEISQILFYCPMVRGDKEDEDANDLIIRELYNISLYSDSDIRNGIIAFLDKVAIYPTAIKDLECGKISILNHLIFSIPMRLSPEEVIKSGHVFTWTIGGDNTDGPVYWVWPLDQRLDGSEKIVVNPKFTIHETTIDGVLKEFDYLAKYYKRAQLSIDGKGHVYRIVRK